MTDAASRAADALSERFPALSRLPRAGVLHAPTPVEDAGSLAPGLWIKRDDLTSPVFGGNKVRSLDFLLGGVRPSDRVVTVGARGSTHALATAMVGRSLGANVAVVLWPQEMTAEAATVEKRTRQSAARVIATRTVAGGMLRAWLLALRGAHWVPPGGTSPLGAIGHVGAALELARQVRDGDLPAPLRVVLPLGSGGTTAGLLAGFAIAGLDTQVVAVRVVPRIVANRGHVLRLAHRTRRLLERLTGEQLPRVDPARLEIVHSAYGGAYGRPTADGTGAARRYLDWSQHRLDPTYTAKAAAVALARAVGTPTLFWLTFDSRCLDAVFPAPRSP